MHRSLLATAAVLLGLGALGGCAASDPQRPIASISPLELVGLDVVSTDGRRILGTVDDVVLTPDRRPAQLLVASGAPMFPNARRVQLDADQFRYSVERQALLLTGMAPGQFDRLSDVSQGAPMAPAVAGTGTGVTNWNGATAPR